MMHVKRSTLLSLASLAAASVLPAVAAAGPTGGHGTASPDSMRTGINREMFESRSLRDEASRGGDNLRVEASPVHVAEPPSPTTVIARPYVIALPLYPLSWYGRSSLGEFIGAQCPMSANSTFVSVAGPNPFLPSDCLHGTFSNGEFDARTHLVSGQNKDALYGRAYDPDSNSIE